MITAFIIYLGTESYQKRVSEASDLLVLDCKGEVNPEAHDATPSSWLNISS